MVSKLCGDVSHPTGGSMYQNGLSGLQVHSLDQRFPCRDQHQRQGSTFYQINVGGFCGAVIFMQRGVFRIAARLITYTAVAEIYRVTHFETCHGTAGRFHYARAVTTQDGGQLVRIISGLGAQFGVQRIDSCGSQLYPQMVWRR